MLGSPAHAATALRQLLRATRPLSGAVANAADAVRDDRLAARGRRHSAVSQAASSGPASWSPMHDAPAPDQPHGLHLCRDDAEQLSHLCDYVTDGLAAGDLCVVVATASHLAGMRHRLELSGVRIPAGRLIALDADETLAALLTDGRPDARLFEWVIGSRLRGLVEGPRPVRAYGEMVDLLNARGDLAGALQLEALWDGLLAELPVTLLCAYRFDERTGDAGTRALVRAAHTHALTSS